MHKITINKIYIRRRTLSQWLTVYLFVMPFLLNAIQAVSNELSILKYTLDVAWVGIVVMALMHPKIRIKRKIFPLACIILGFFLYCVVVYSFRYQSVVYFLWGFRNNFRFYAAFLAFAVLMDEKDAETAFRIMDVLFWINVAVSMIQFFVLGYRQDYLGGIFGVEKGCNSQTLMFFSLILTRSALLMMTGKRKNVICVIQFLVTSVIAAMAELKAFFLILGVILVLSMIMTSFSWKKCILAILAVVCLSVGSSILVSVFGKSDSLSIEHIKRLILSRNYATSKDLGRLTAIPVLSRTILAKPLDRIFGLGLGNCDTSSFAICNTPFFQSHSYLNYHWFSSAFLFLETGYLGLFQFVLFFAACAAGSLKLLLQKRGNDLYCRMGIIMAVLCVVLMIYNSSLRTEIGYLAYFALALPFMDQNSRERSVIAANQEGN